MKSRDLDVLFILGPDEPAQTRTELAAFLETACSNAQLNYQIMGDGIIPGTSRNLGDLPKAKHVFIICHGDVRESKNHEARHMIQITDVETASPTLEVLRKIQESTKSKKIVLASCYGGKVNEDIKKAGGQGANLELVTLSAPDEMTDQSMIKPAAIAFIEAIRNNKKSADMAQAFNQMTRSIPETFTYGIQNKKGYQTHTSRRQENPTGNKSSVARWAEYQHGKLNDYLKSNNKQPIQYTPLTPDEIVRFQTHSALDAIFRDDLPRARNIMQENRDIDTMYISQNILGRIEVLTKYNHPSNTIDALHFALQQAPRSVGVVYNNEYILSSESRRLQLTRGLLTVAENCAPALSKQIMSVLLPHHTPTQLLREADTLGLTKVGKALIASYPISDANIGDAIKVDAYALAFASTQARNNPDMVNKSALRDGQFGFLKYAGDEAIASLVNNQLLTQSDVTRQKYEALNHELKHNILLMNRKDQDPESHKATARVIAAQTRELQEMKRSLPAAVVALIDYAEAMDSKKALASNMQRNHATPQLRTRLIEGVKNLEKSERNARSRLADVNEKQKPTSEVSRREQERNAYKKHQQPNNIKINAKSPAPSAPDEPQENNNNNSPRSSRPL